MLQVGQRIERAVSPDLEGMFAIATAERNAAVVDAVIATGDLHIERLRDSIEALPGRGIHHPMMQPDMPQRWLAFFIILVGRFHLPLPLAYAIRRDRTHDLTSGVGSIGVGVAKLGGHAPNFSL